MSLQDAYKIQGNSVSTSRLRIKIGVSRSSARTQATEIITIFCIVRLLVPHHTKQSPRRHARALLFPGFGNSLKPTCRDQTKKALPPSTAKRYPHACPLQFNISATLTVSHSYP